MRGITHTTISSYIYDQMGGPSGLFQWAGKSYIVTVGLLSTLINYAVVVLMEEDTIITHILLSEAVIG